MGDGGADSVGALADSLGQVSEAFTRAAGRGTIVAEACTQRRRTASRDADDYGDRQAPFADPAGDTVWVPEGEIIEWLAARRLESASKAESASALAIAWDIASTRSAVTGIADWLDAAARDMIRWMDRCTTAIRFERADASGSWYGLIDPAYAVHRTCLVELCGSLTELAGRLREALAACSGFLDAVDAITEG